MLTEDDVGGGGVPRELARLQRRLEEADTVWEGRLQALKQNHKEQVKSQPGRQEGRQALVVMVVAVGDGDGWGCMINPSVCLSVDGVSVDQAAQGRDRAAGPGRCHRSATGKKPHRQTDRQREGGREGSRPACVLVVGCWLSLQERQSRLLDKVKAEKKAALEQLDRQL